MRKDHPVIGDFRGPATNAPRDPAPAPETEAAPTEREKEKKKTEPPSWAGRLKAAGISEKEALGIIDAVLDKGYYEEEFLLRGKVGVLRTRTHEDFLRMQEQLELQRPQLQISQDALITRYSLAASLVKWDQTVFKHDTEDDFGLVDDFLRKMSAPLYSLLSSQLSKFDTKMLLIFSEGAPENF